MMYIKSGEICFLIPNLCLLRDHNKSHFKAKLNCVIKQQQLLKSFIINNYKSLLIFMQYN